MSATTALPAHRFWPQHTDILINQMSHEKTDLHLKEVLKKANEVLEKRGIEVVFLDHVPHQPSVKGVDPKLNLLLGISSTDRSEPIDILDLKALDEQSLKPVDLLAEEVLAKVEQHLAARKTDGILCSRSGSKLDTRRLENHRVSIDSKGYLTIDQKRIYAVLDEGCMPLKAERLRSYTILRFIQESETKIRVIDDYDFIRPNAKGMYFNLTPRILPSSQVIEDLKKDAQEYFDTYFDVGRDVLTQPIKDNLLAEVIKFPAP